MKAILSLALAALASAASAAPCALTFDVRAAGAGVAVSDGTGDASALPRLDYRGWIQQAASAVAAYYERFPVDRLRVCVTPLASGVVGGGRTTMRGIPVIRIGVGPDVAGDEGLRGSWVLTHEMVHLASPWLAGDYEWFDEGLATYVEPIIRVRAGNLSPDEIWRWLLWGLPRGLPKDGDGGLDATHSRGRAYWGGALYFLLADLEIRERTDGRKSLDDALRGILAAGGNVTKPWTLEETIRAADRATGVPVLAELYAKMGPTASTVDLAALFRRLGVSDRSGRIVYDDTAPLAAVRSSLSRGPRGKTL